MVQKYVMANRGSEQDAQDIFQDAYYLFVTKIQAPDFQLTALPSTFIYGISKNLWLKTLTQKQIDLDLLDKENQLNESIEEEENDWNKINRVKQMKNSIMALGEPCKTILEQFYFLRTSMKKIAELLHYSNPEHAKNQKYKCFIRLKKLMAAHIED